MDVQIIAAQLAGLPIGVRAATYMTGSELQLVTVPELPLAQRCADAGSVLTAALTPTDTPVGLKPVAGP
jgi:hypothetical protein